MTPEERIRKAEEEIGKLQAHHKTFRTKIDSTVRKIDGLTHDRFLSDDCRAARAGDLAEIKALYESLLAAAQRQVASLEQAMAAAVAEKKRSEEIEDQKRREKKATEAEDSGGGAGAGRDLGKEAQEPVPGDEGGVSTATAEATYTTPAAAGGAAASGGTSTGAFSGGIGMSNLSVLDNPSVAAGGQSHSASLLDDAIAAVIGGFTVEEIRTLDPLPAGKLKEKLEEAAKKAKEWGQEALNALRKTFATQGLDLHDLSKEQSAAGKLTKAQGFEEKTMGEKAADVNGFFAEQDKLRDNAWKRVYQQDDAKIAKALGITSPPGSSPGRAELENGLQAARESESREVQQWRSEYVNGLCKDEASRQVAEENRAARQNWVKRLDDLNREAPAAQGREFRDMQEAKAGGKIVEKTEELQNRHFPDLEPPERGSRSAPSPEMEGPAPPSPGSTSGPGGGR